MNLRLADESVLAALEEMLREAVNWSSEGTLVALDDLRANDTLVRYVDDWPRDDDAGVIAEEADRVVGAAWFRRFSQDRVGFGFIDEFTPEVSVAIAPGWRWVPPSAARAVEGVQAHVRTPMAASPRASRRSACTRLPAFQWDGPARRPLPAADPVRRDCISERVHLVDRRDRPLGRVLDASAL
jgi:hypothetical protein